MKAVLNWLDDRTGFRALMHEALYESIPGGSRWRYVWGSTLVFAFSVQVITGLFLWMAYSPSAGSAWESIYYIQNEMQFGWLLRGVHHFMAQLMVVLLALHMLQVVWDGAYRAPREVNFWLGLVLLQIVLGLSLTGYLLPWDQKGFWATKVATEIMGTVPVVGEHVQKVVVGGEDYGHHTITRFFALHAGVLPALLVFFLVLHIAIFRRHGIHAKHPTRAPDTTFWPDQVLKDAVVCLAVLATVIALSIHFRGAELGAPADPASPYDAARPEWYFLFLFQFLKFFPGETEVIGAVVIPGLVMGFLFLMPLIGRSKLGHVFNILFILALLGGAGFLTYLAVRDDRANDNYAIAVKLAEEDGERAAELASLGIPREGAAFMMRNDSFTQGRRLFADNCAACHSCSPDDNSGIVAPEPSAPNLYRFGTRRWLARFFDFETFSSPDVFGKTKHFNDGSMREIVAAVPDWTDEERAQLKQVEFAIAAESGLKDPDEPASEADIEAGRKLLEGEGSTLRSQCTDCHNFRSVKNDGGAPDLTGWGSRDWLHAFLQDPGHARFYGEKNDRMPAFGEKELLSSAEIEHIITWLRGEWVRGPVKEE